MICRAGDEMGLCCVGEIGFGREGIDEVEAVQSIFLLPSGVACGFPGSRVYFLVYCTLLPCQSAVDREQKATHSLGSCELLKALGTDS